MVNADASIAGLRAIELKAGWHVVDEAKPREKFPAEAEGIIYTRPETWHGARGRLD